MGVWTQDSTKLGWLTSILELGAWVGTLYSGFLAEILSRKYAILINVFVFCIGVVVQATAITSSGHNSILGGRFITGKIHCTRLVIQIAGIVLSCQFGANITV